MRYKTFRNLVVAGGAAVLVAVVAGLVGLVSLAGRSSPAPLPASPSAPATPSRPTTPATPPASPTAPADPSLRPVDLAILNLIKNAATSDKIKDAFPNQPYKVNLYKDGSGMVWTRLKIDLDRDELDDEKWDLLNGAPAKRHVSTKDDGTYDAEYRWDGAKWVQKSS